MIDEQLTFDTYGYYPTHLSISSNKPIKVVCDYCNNIYESNLKRRKASHLKLPKDACNGCKYKKRDEIAPNPMTRDDVKAKVKKTNLERYGSESITNSEHFKEKAKITNIARYGTEKPIQSKVVQDRLKSVFLEKYGVDNPSSLPEIQAKRDATCLEKYGAEKFLASDYAKEKIKKTFQERYGVNNAFQVPEFQEKAKQSNLSRIGVEHPTQNKSVMEKQIRTVFERYGVNHIFSSASIREQIKKTNLARYGYEFPTQNPEIKKKIIDTMIKNGYAKEFSGKTMRELSDELNKAYTTFVYQVRNHGFEEAIKLPVYTNGLEQIFANWLDETHINYVTQFRIDNRIADFYLPDANLLIELNGNYWHSDLIIEDNKYHFNKKKLYNSHGYASFFFREDEINNKFDIIKSMVLNKLKLGSKTYARKCEIKEVDNEQAVVFCEENHLMGRGIGKAYGLYQGDTLLSLLQVKLRSSIYHVYEISRFCIKTNFSVIGGFSRLLNHFLKLEKPNQLITFVDNRYGGEATYLYDLGFKFESNYPSFRWVANQQTFHRLKYPSNSGYEQGLAKLWDCGQSKFVLNLR